MCPPTALEVFRGDSFAFLLTVTLDDGIYDLTGAKLTFTLKARKTDSDPGVISKTIGDGITVAAPENGQAEISLGADETANLTPGFTYFFDVQLEPAAEAGGGVHTVAIGTLAVHQDITLST